MPLLMMVPLLTMEAPLEKMSWSSFQVNVSPLGTVKVPLGMVRLKPLASMTTELVMVILDSETLESSSMVWPSAAALIASCRFW